MVETMTPEEAKIPEKREKYQKLLLDTIKSNPDLVAKYFELGTNRSELLAEIILKMDLPEVYVYQLSEHGDNEELKIFAERPKEAKGSYGDYRDYDPKISGYLSYTQNLSVGLGRYEGRSSEVGSAIGMFARNMELTSETDLIPQEFKGMTGVRHSAILYQFKKKEQLEKN